jgi:hypothetical protein
MADVEEGLEPAARRDVPRAGGGASPGGSRAIIARVKEGGSLEGWETLTLPTRIPAAGLSSHRLAKGSIRGQGDPTSGGLGP